MSQKWSDFQNSSCYLYLNKILMRVNLIEEYQNLVISKFREKNKKVVVALEICIENDIVLGNMCQGN